jgi:aerobic carbon-monoxide dehydrogenase medium subunit
LKPPLFDYAAPTTLDEAIGLLTEHADVEARVLAGGQSLIPMMNFRLAKPGYLVDLRRVAGLAGIRRDGNTLVIGAMTRMAEVERSPEVAVAAPLVTEAIGLVAHVPVRNSGTVGGSLAHADPAAELPAVALALDAELVAVGPGGTRTIPAAEFFTGPYSTALAAEEILTEVRLPVWPGGHAFTEFSRIHANFAVVAVAALIEADGDVVRQASIALAGVGPTPVRARSAEQILTGSSGDAEVIRAAAQAGAADLSPAGDLHASAETRRALAQTYLRRGLELAVARARNER